MNNYYCYAYLREDGSPYYIGKGLGKRAYQKAKCHRVKPPKDQSRIVILKDNLTEQQAFDMEVFYIQLYGRKDLETGILRNMTDGGEGMSGMKHSEEAKLKISNKRKELYKNVNFIAKMSECQKGKKLSEDTKNKISFQSKKMWNNQDFKNNMIEVRQNISDVTKDKISLSLRGNKRSGKPIIILNVETGIAHQYSSTLEAGRELEVNANSLWDHFNRKPIKYMKHLILLGEN